MQTIKLTAHVVNSYPETGSRIATVTSAELPVPPGPLPLDGEPAPVAVQEWIDSHLLSLTGTGRSKGLARYELEVTASSRPDLVPGGYTHEWEADDA